MNTLADNPSMPYYDPGEAVGRELVQRHQTQLRRRDHPAALEQLRRERGLCVLYQYMHRYADLAAGRVHERFRVSAERLMGDAPTSGSTPPRR